MNWRVSFYNQRVMKSIQDWPPNIKAKFTWIVELIENFGPDEIGMPHVKPMKKGLFLRLEQKEMKVSDEPFFVSRKVVLL